MEFRYLKKKKIDKCNINNDKTVLHILNLKQNKSFNRWGGGVSIMIS